MATEQSTLMLEELYALYSAKQLFKPSIQRVKRWTHDQSLQFIHFIIDLHNLITPFLLNKTIVDGKELYGVIDGNNRIHAILQFYQAPLPFLDTDLTTRLRAAYPDALYRALSFMTYRQWLSTTSLSEFCRQQSENAAFDAFQWYNDNNDRAGRIEEAYRAVHTSLVRTRFDQIKVPIVVFRGMTDEKIIRIFEAVNTTGVRLTEQEIIKAISSLTLYGPEDNLPHFAEIHNALRDHLELARDQEMLAEFKQSGMMLSTHDVLFGLQCWLQAQYHWVLDSPGNSSGRSGAADLDTVFKFYKLLYNGRFDEKNPARMRDFIERMRLFCQITNKVYDQMYGLKNFSESSVRLSLNRTMVLFAYLYKDYSRRPHQDWVRLLYYNEIVGFLNDFRRKHGLPEEVIVGYSKQNPLHFVTNGRFTDGMVRRILNADVGGAGGDGEDGGEAASWVVFPSLELIREALMLCLRSSVAPTDFATRKRSRPTRFECFVLSSYFYRFLPPCVLCEPLDSDHIFPLATDGWTGPVDIHRVGNKMLINSRINLKKSNHPVTDAFIAEHKLMYFNYPVQDIYAAILSPTHPRLLRHDLYNAWCERRELAYVDGILDLLSQPYDLLSITQYVSNIR